MAAKITNQQWQRLYKAADKLYEIQPWQWMYEDELFAVVNPDTGEPGFVTVLGNANEHFAVGVYLGWQAYHDINELMFDAEMTQPERILEIAQLQASWEDRNQLEKTERALIKRLNLSYRGKNAWPQFRSYQPGFFPWFLDAEEVRDLTLILEQAAEVLPRLRDDKTLLESAEAENLFARLATKTKDSLQWRDGQIAVDYLEEDPPKPPVSPLSLQEFATRNATCEYLEADFFMMPSPVMDKASRPKMPYMLVAADPTNGMIVIHKILTVETTFDDLLQTVPALLIEGLNRIKIRPSAIFSTSEYLLDLLTPLQEDLKLHIDYEEELPAIMQIRTGMLQQMLGKQADDLPL